ncbi:hypothetical protein SCG7109_BZ_00010 [Chlamydiales bacterium SCGC AG-110-M15]|nr:hypothetical protein SCG7109_BZ_00010 [Chlamydiales bacterium SCGC AG-110-M15]
MIESASTSIVASVTKPIIKKAVEEVVKTVGPKVIVYASTTKFKPRDTGKKLDELYNNVTYYVNPALDILTGRILGVQFFQYALKDCCIYTYPKRWVSRQSSNFLRREFSSVTHAALMKGSLKALTKAIQAIAKEHLKVQLQLDSNETRDNTVKLLEAEGFALEREYVSPELVRFHLPELIRGYAYDHDQRARRQKEKEKKALSYYGMLSNQVSYYWGSAPKAVVENGPELGIEVLDQLIDNAEKEAEIQILGGLEERVLATMEEISQKVSELAAEVFANRARMEIESNVDSSVQELCAQGSAISSLFLLGNIGGVCEAIIASSHIVTRVLPTTLYCGYLLTSSMLPKQKGKNTPFLNRMFKHLKHEALTDEIFAGLQTQLPADLREKVGAELKAQMALAKEGSRATLLKNEQVTMDFLKELDKSIDPLEDDEGKMRAEVEKLLGQFYTAL